MRWVLPADFITKLTFRHFFPHAFIIICFSIFVNCYFTFFSIYDQNSGCTKKMFTNIIIGDQQYFSVFYSRIPPECCRRHRSKNRPIDIFHNFLRRRRRGIPESAKREENVLSAFSLLFYLDYSGYLPLFPPFLPLLSAQSVSTYRSPQNCLVINFFAFMCNMHIFSCRCNKNLTLLQIYARIIT